MTPKITFVLHPEYKKPALTPGDVLEENMV